MDCRYVQKHSLVPLASCLSHPVFLLCHTGSAVDSHHLFRGSILKNKQFLRRMLTPSSFVVVYDNHNSFLVQFSNQVIFWTSTKTNLFRGSIQRPRQFLIPRSFVAVYENRSSFLIQYSNQVSIQASTRKTNATTGFVVAQGRIWFPF